MKAWAVKFSNTGPGGNFDTYYVTAPNIVRAIVKAERRFEKESSGYHHRPKPVIVEASLEVEAR